MWFWEYKAHLDRQKHSTQGSLKALTGREAIPKQNDKYDIMASEQANITETIAQVAAEAARVEVHHMVIANIDNSQRIQNVVVCQSTIN